MSDALGAALAFVAFGVLFAGSVLLLILNPRSRGGRWWVLFQAANLVWLGAQGWAFAAGAWERLGPVVSATAHLLPAFFLAFALVEGLNRPDRDGVLALLLGFLTLPLDVAPRGQLRSEWFVVLWHVAVWGAATWAMIRGRRFNPRDPEVDRRLGRLVSLGLLVVGPIALVGGTTLGMRMWFYAMPLLVVWIQLLLFVGIARLRYYDIEVRARRTGELAARAAEQERLAVLGELSASLAHEIRNPLTGVRSLAQRLAEEEVDEPRRRRYAGVILDEVGRVERLVANLLGVARRAPRTAEPAAPVPLQELFDDLLLLLAGKAEKAGVRLRADAGRLVVPAPREPLTQALLNLLFNAVQHTPAGGTVELAATGTPEGVELVVRDQGPGVSPADRERIWEPFFTGGSGTGLGLAVVRRLAREHGWEVRAGDAPEGGAEFRLRLTEPVAVALAATTGRRARRVPGPDWEREEDD